MLPKLQEFNSKCKGETGDVHEHIDICLVGLYFKIDFVPELYAYNVT